jgi:hypothetical protein
MSVETGMSILSFTEFVLWAALGILFWSRKLHRRFPAMGVYLALRVASMPVLMLLYHGQSEHWLNGYCYATYFYCFWAVHMASAVILYFVATEVFRSALSAYEGLSKFGIVAFRWAALASVIVGCSTISFAHRGILLIPGIAVAMMRSVSILELCLLGFLCLSMNALRLSARDLAFGIALGFGMMSTDDFVQSLLISDRTSLTAPLQFFYESLILVSLGLWIAYCALPEPARKPVTMAVNSTVYRWNEIASALGHTGTQVVVPQPANGFFLTDVEKVVDKVLNRALNASESES